MFSDDLLLVIIGFFPGGIANLLPPGLVKIKKLQFLKTPIDFDLKLGNNPVFGPNKTILGFVGGVLVSTIISVIIYKSLAQYEFALEYISLIKNYNIVLYSFIISTGALTGDLVKSFFKRRLGVYSGKKFIPFDQLDYVFGMYAFQRVFYPQLKVNVLLMILFWGFSHVVVKYIGYLLDIRKEPI